MIKQLKQDWSSLSAAQWWADLSHNPYLHYPSYSHPSHCKEHGLSASTLDRECPTSIKMDFWGPKEEGFSQKTPGLPSLLLSQIPAIFSHQSYSCHLGKDTIFSISRLEALKVPAKVISCLVVFSPPCLEN